MLWILFLIASLLPSSLLPAPAPVEGWKISVSKNKEELTLQDTLQVTIQCDYVSSYEPNLFEFLHRQKSSRQYDNFLLLSSSYSQENSHLTIFLELKPLRIGALFFVPGILSFTSKASPPQSIHYLLVPSFSIECRRLFSVQVAPPLVVRPEESITMSKENREHVFERQLAQEDRRNQELQKERLAAWTIFILIMTLALGILLTFWCLAKSTLLVPKKENTSILPKCDYKSQFLALQQSKDPLPVRFEKVSSLFRDFLSEVEKKPLQGKTNQELWLIIQNSEKLTNKEDLKKLCAMLEMLEFSPNPPMELDWQALCLVFPRF
ncbi:MAG: hypothetical protein JWO53_753 [Chlamydiia bacterium]|nr:hypothetical protein [Chlamydiia bacterium]